MRIRTKLLAAVAVPLVLLVAQVAAVSVFIRELQSAVTFIGEAHRVIEADFGALELVGALREEVKRLPSRYVSAPANAAAEVNPMQALWDQLTSRVDLIEASGVALAIEPHVLEAVRQAFGKASEQYERTEEVADSAANLDTLIERAVFVDKALAELAEALQVLAVELRKQLQAAVDREREIHNRPVIAGIAIGGLALLLLMAFAWRYVRHLVGPIRALEEGATRIGRGDLTSRIDVRTGDELQSLAEHFNQMAGQLQESP